MAAGGRGQMAGNCTVTLVLVAVIGTRWLFNNWPATVLSHLSSLPPVKGENAVLSQFFAVISIRSASWNKFSGANICLSCFVVVCCFWVGFCLCFCFMLWLFALGHVLAKLS